MLIKRWDEKLLPEESLHVSCELALLFAARINDEELRRKLSALVTHRDLRGLCDFTLDYSECSREDAEYCRQATACFTKNADLTLGLDRERVTLDKLHAAEARCKETNDIFQEWGRGRFQFPPRVEARFHEAARLISRTLGDVPDLAQLRFCFGPGATTNVKKKDAAHIAKCEEPLTCSEELLPIVHHVLAEMPALADAHSLETESDRVDREIRHWLTEAGVIPAKVEVDESCDTPANLCCAASSRANVLVTTSPSKLGFAPKNASALRTTCTQPSLSMMFQLGIGDYLDVKLKAVGVDIHDQGRNQMLAKMGSLTGDVATLDLVSASDCKAKGLVQHLLPLPWFEFLSYGRCGYCELPTGRVIRMAQFSSMGNGFTFPLETLVFWALTQVCVPKTRKHLVSVYGDDIICPVECVADVRELLNAAGFWVNEKKSFSTGPFRESCGVDYYNGVNIRPYYIKADLSGMSIFSMHNFFRRKGDDEAADLLLSFLDPLLLRWGPDGYGDGHLLQPTYGWCGQYEKYSQHVGRLWGVVSPNHARRGFGGVTFSTYTTKGRRTVRSYVGDYVYPLYSVYVNGDPGRPRYNAVVPGRRHLELDDAGPSFTWKPHQAFLNNLAETLDWERRAPAGRGVVYTEDGSLECVIPGWQGYKEVRIYTLDT